jgi:DNA-binding IclR family transcriptional regulator
LIRRRGYALDEEEMFPGLTCIAVPIHIDGRSVAAISLIAAQNAEPSRPTAHLSRLQVAAGQIESRLFLFKDILLSHRENVAGA